MNVIPKRSVYRGRKRATGELSKASEDIVHLCLNDSELFAEWVTDNVGLVKSIVDDILRGKPYAQYFDRPDAPVTRDDLISAGILGLYAARNRFDPTKGVKFVTYAYNWIRCYVYREIQKALKGAFADSLDYTVFDDGEATYADVLPSQRRNPEEEVTARMLKEAVSRLLDCLSPEEKEVVTSLWMEGKTPTRLAKEWRVPQKRIIELKRSAVEKMRKALYTRQSHLDRKTKAFLISFRQG